MKVWIYKGDILPCKSLLEDKITREAAMAVGETSGQTKPGKVVSSSAAAHRRPAEEVAPEPEEVPSEVAAETEAEPAPLVKEGDAEFEKLLAEEEAIEASTREQHEAPHFRSGDGD